MKKRLLTLIVAIVSICVYAQKDVTKFLGIPVDGSKSEMIQKIKAKGFRSNSYNHDVLEGEFNGNEVRVYIGTNGNKVWRIMVCDANSIDERSIQIRFNKLCHQFIDNPKYIFITDNMLIPDDEDIRYETTVNKKRYEAVFYQKPSETNDSLYNEEIRSIALKKYSAEELENPTDEIKEYINEITLNYIYDLYTKKSVWFMISEDYGKFSITMFYDNEYNRANGEDL